jgi:polar amino acid transport system substrate-binding protein
VRKVTGLIAVLALLVGLAACGNDDSGSGGSTTPPKCSTAVARRFTPVKPGTLTVATALPAPGFWNGDDPESIDGGFEYGIVQGIAQRAGLSKVELKNVSFDALVAGGVKDYDVGFSQITITPARRKLLCFTTDYFSSDQGVLVRAGTKVTEANQKKLKWGVQASTTGELFLKDRVQPDEDGTVYQDTPEMFTALRARQIDAVLLDTRIVIQQAAESGGALEVAGQYETGEKYGGIVESGSPNIGLLDRSIDAMKTDGTLKRLSSEFLGDPSTVPYLAP